MLKTHRIIKPTTRHVGEPSSKYGYDPTGQQFEKDIQAHLDRSDFLWAEFIAFMKSHNATPEDFRWMFAKYYDEFIK